MKTNWIDDIPAPKDEEITSDIIRIDDEYFKNELPEVNQQVKIKLSDDHLIYSIELLSKQNIKFPLYKKYMYNGDEWDFVGYSSDHESDDEKPDKLPRKPYLSKKVFIKFLHDLLEYMSNLEEGQRETMMLVKYQDITNYITTFMETNNLKRKMIQHNGKRKKNGNNNSKDTNTRKKSRYNAFIQSMMTKMREERSNDILPKSRMSLSVKIWQYVNTHLKVNDDTKQEDIDMYEREWWENEYKK